MGDNPFQIIPKVLLARRGFLALVSFLVIGVAAIHVQDMSSTEGRPSSLYATEALMGVSKNEFLRIEKTSILLGYALADRCITSPPVSSFEGERCRELQREFEISLLWSLGPPIGFLFLVLTLSGSAVQTYRGFRRSVQKIRPLGTAKILAVSDQQGFWCWRQGVIAYDAQMDTGKMARVYLPLSYRKLKKGDPIAVFPIPGRTAARQDSQAPETVEGVAKFYAPHLSVR
ncbi:MAG: hypothetical protein JNL01_10130 [Bdellovibrionales bacterium]|nr:hypothetical protein [Bdellovibrionales bacterium]